MVSDETQRGPETASPGPCGHEANGHGFFYVCDLPSGHRGWHRSRTELRDSVSITNWGDDGLARHASKDERRRKESGH